MTLPWARHRCRLIIIIIIFVLIWLFSSLCALMLTDPITQLSFSLLVWTGPARDVTSFANILRNPIADADPLGQRRHHL
jgi:hypothetical protein